jgi:hypothetical protein
MLRARKFVNFGSAIGIYYIQPLGAHPVMQMGGDGEVLGEGASKWRVLHAAGRLAHVWLALSVAPLCVVVWDGRGRGSRVPALNRAQHSLPKLNSTASRSASSTVPSQLMSSLR